MAKYNITGVWKDNNGTITHYAFHSADTVNKFGPLTKRSKAEAIRIVETSGNSVMTLVWNYVKCGWYDGEEVYVAGTGTNKYLKSKPDVKVSDNLDNLICWNGFIA